MKPAEQIIPCETAEEVIEACKKEYATPEIYGDFTLEVDSWTSLNIAQGSPTIILRGDRSHKTIGSTGLSTPTVITYGATKVFVTPFEESCPTVIAKDVSQPFIAPHGSRGANIVCQDCSHPRIESFGRGKVQILAEGSSQPFIKNTGLVLPELVLRNQARPIIQGAIRVAYSDSDATLCVIGEGSDNQITGSCKVQRMLSNDSMAWVKFFSLPVLHKEYVYLFSALNGDYENFRKQKLIPGTTVEDPNWNLVGNVGGIYLSPNALVSTQEGWGNKFVACKVKISEMLIDYTGEHPERARVPRIYEIFEVSCLGDRVGEIPRNFTFGDSP